MRPVLDGANGIAAMRGSAQNAKTWRPWHRSLRLASWRTLASGYLRAHCNLGCAQVPAAVGYLAIFAKTAKKFRWLSHFRPDFCVNVKGALTPSQVALSRSCSTLILLIVFPNLQKLIATSILVQVKLHPRRVAPELFPPRLS